MNNIELIKEDYAIGEPIRLSCSLGVKEGFIQNFLADRIVLRPFQQGRKSFSVHDSTITDWEEAEPVNDTAVSNIEPPTPIQHYTQHNDEEIVEMQKGDESHVDTSSGSSTVIEKSIEKEDTPAVDEQHDGKEKSSDGIPKVGVTVVGKIPENELLRIDPKIGKKKKDKMVGLGNGLSALSAVVTETDLVEREKYVPANGIIAVIDKKQGRVLDSKTNRRVYFKTSEVVDPEIEIYKSVHTPVVYRIVESDNGLFQAVGIHKPSQIGRLLELVNTLTCNGNTKAAIRILDNILTAHPDNSEASRLKESLVHKTNSSLPFWGNYYKLAERAHLVQKNYELAVNLYIKAIESGDRTESAIKDLCMLLLSLYKNERTPENFNRAVSTLDKYKASLPLDSLANLNFLRGFYFSIEDFDSYDKILYRLLEHASVISNHKRRSELFTEEAVSYIKQNDLENAQSAITDALDEDPYNKAALNLKQLIMNPQLDAETLSRFTAQDFFQFTHGNGLSSFIQNTLNEYTEYVGVPERIRDNLSKISPTTLKEVREAISNPNLIGRHSLRAKYLLTQAKLLEKLDPDNRLELRKTLILYCNSMASSHLVDSSMDVVRFFYHEAFALSQDQKFGDLAPQVSNAILTYVYSGANILNKKRKTLTLQEAVRTGYSVLRFPILWNALLELSLNSREISAHVVDVIYRDRDFKAGVLKYLDTNQELSIDCSEDEFRKMWNLARQHRLNEIANFENRVKVFHSIDIEMFQSAFIEIAEHLPQWLPELDAQRFNAIKERLLPVLDAYLKSTGYRNKEKNYNLICDLIEEMSAEIAKQPTGISFNFIAPLIQALRTLLDNSFTDIKMASQPKLSVSLLTAETVINDDKRVAFKIALGNDKMSSSIRKIRFSVLEEDGIKYIPTEKDITDYNALDGGEEKVYELCIQINKLHASTQAFPITIVVDYDASGEDKQFQEQISLKLYSPKDFAPIDNPYAPFADGGPVPPDSKMFFGRQSFIDNIVSAFRQTSSKQIIIYGQKRCGKSSVMSHIKDILQKDGHFFCASFSLGEIIKNLTEYSFYHKILTSIENELDDWHIDHPEESTPEFKVVPLDEFKKMDSDNPLNTFISYIRKFKQACRSLGGAWAKYNLVVMIDEFTYMYTGIRKGEISDTIMKQWKAITQNPQTQFSVILVGQDVIPTFKKEDYARNAFGVIQDIRLTYLQDAPARELIEKPILLPSGQSRYVGKAVDRIIEYTSRNPYYIQIFCSRLVEYLNENKSIYITEAEVNSVANSFIRGEHALEEDKFDNLIRPGESEELQEFKDRDVLTLLRQMASLSNNIGFCREQDLDSIDNSELRTRILGNLVDREVIERIGGDKYKIQVKLFQEWLLTH